MNEKQRLNVKNVEDVLRLGPMQEGMFFQYLRNPTSKQYIEQFSYNITGEIDHTLFRRAWQLVVENNEMLRTVFKWDKLDKPVQIILKEEAVTIKEYDLSTYGETEREEWLNTLKVSEIETGFDLIFGPLFKIYLCKLAKDNYEMFIQNHHIIFDGWSNGILLKEFFMVYRQLIQGEVPIKKSKTKFKDYLKWCQQQDKGKQKEFWQDYLAGFESTTQLPYDQKKEKEIAKADTYRVKLSDSLCHHIDNIAVQEKVTIGCILYAAYGILLQKYNNTQDIIFGTTVSGRPTDLPEVENMVGLFINTLPLRVRTIKTQSVANLFCNIQEMIQKQHEFACTPLVEIKSYSEIGPKQALFDSIVVLENYPLDESQLLNGSSIYINSCTTIETTNFDLTLGIMTYNGIELNFSYNPELFERKTIIRLAGHFQNILTQILENTQATVSDLEMISLEEKELLLHTWNETDTAFPREKTVFELFAEYAVSHPTDPAVIFGEEQLSYGELLIESSRLAKYLQSSGVGVFSVVAIMLPRSLKQIISILGVLKAGGAYLPIDPAYPDERIEYILRDSGAGYLISTEDVITRVKFSGINIPLHMVMQSENYSNVNLDDAEDLTERVAIHPENLAYIIYTSGSTGQPKGVMLEHHSLTNTVWWRKNEYHLSSHDRVLQLFSFAFDGFITSFFTPLISGALIVLVGDMDVKDPVFLRDVIRKQGITHFIAVPSLYKSILEVMNSEDAQSLRIVTLAGEQVSPALIQKSKEINPDLELVNEYGPTENCVASTIEREMQVDQLVTIGRPIANTKVYIFDRNNCLMPVGVPGELCLSGEGIARGYLNLSEMTQSKFVENPYCLSEKLYHTGDLARRLPDGRVEFLGRIDHQVKIRGFRIELGEIEAKLLTCPAIEAAAVIAQKSEEGDSFLVAYLVLRKDISLQEINAFLTEDLPDYMIPSYFVTMDSLPLTAGGKIDRHALLEVAVDSSCMITGSEYIAPTGPVQEKLAEIWSEILQIEKIGIDDDFFKIGGHSLKATTLVAKIYKEFQIRVPLGELFTYSTLREQAGILEKMKKTTFTTITKANELEYYSIPSAPKRLYILQQMDEKNVNYNMPGVLTVQGDLQQEQLQAALQRLIRRHESLRTRFIMVDGEPVQQILPDVEIELTYWQAKPGQVEDIVANFVRPFNLSQAPLFRVGLIGVSQAESKQNEINPDYHVLLFDMHHIISDGISMNIFIHDLTALYEGKQLPELSVQYKDFALWEQQNYNSIEVQKAEEYWLNEFADDIPVLALPTDYSRPLMKNFVGDTYHFVIDSELKADLYRLAEETKTTLYMVLLAAYNLLLARYSGQEDIVVGSPTAGRTLSEQENIIGMFVNTLALRTRPKSEKQFKDFLSEVKAIVLGAFENQNFQFEKLIEKLNLAKDFSRHPLFDTMFALQNQTISTVRIAGLEFTQRNYINKVAKFDLTLNAVEMEDSKHNGNTTQQNANNTIQFSFEYSTQLFARDSIERMAKHFVNILKVVTANREIQLKEVDLFSSEEREQLLNVWNATQTDYPKNQTITEIFAEVVKTYPDRVAVEFEEQKMTYAQLNARANQLAWRLREKGICVEQTVALLTECSVEMIVAIFAVLKAGGAYVPIDPDYPEARIRYMLEDCEATVLLIGREATEPGTFYQGEILSLDDDSSYSSVTIDLPPVNTSDNLAYIIYTSGTTGKPKGNLTMHYNITRVVKKTNYIEFIPEDRVLQLSNYAFDGSVFNIFGALLNGAELVLLKKDLILNIPELANFIFMKDITVFFITTALFNALVEANVDALRKVRKILFGGERASYKHVEKAFLVLGLGRLIHVYGPTESTVFATAYEVNSFDSHAETVPIGSPLANTRVYVLSKDAQLQPIGVQGELWIAGDGIARGYLKRPELTAEKFCSDPFVGGAQAYRTGDLVKWLPNGNIEFIGRIDNQVKLRGFRIELGEIETELLSIDMIRETVVIDRRSKSGNHYLAAYYIAAREIKALEFREILAQNLPSYMIPSYFVKLDKMPLTINGKIDKSALPEPDEGSMGLEYIAPETVVERRLAKIWAELLGVQTIGLHDNFFHLGGHSLKAAQLVSMVLKEFGVELALSEVFKNPDLQGMAGLIEKSQGGQYVRIEKVAKSEYYPLSSVQKRLLILNQLVDQDISYNMPIGLSVEGTIERERLQHVFDRLLKRHESLRTCFEFVDGRPVQRIQENVELKIEELRVEFDQLEQIKRDFIRPFDLSRASLLRVGLVTCGNQHYLLFDMHHIISDGISLQNLLHEFVELYQGHELLDLPVQYKDFVAWQSQLFKTEKMRKQESFWLEKFTGELPVLKLPTDGSCIGGADFRGSSIEFLVEDGEMQNLLELTEQTHATLYMLLFACYNILLAKISGTTDVIIGSPVAGRNHPDLENLIGMFVNTLAIRNQPESDKTFREFLTEVRENVLRAFENGDYPFELLGEKLGLKWKPGENPLFNTVFALQEEHESEWASDNLVFKPLNMKMDIAKFDLTLTAQLRKKEVHFIFEFRTGLFKSTTVEQMAKDYLKILKTVVVNPEITIGEIQLERLRKLKKAPVDEVIFNF